MKIDNCRLCNSPLPVPKDLKILDSNLSLYTCGYCGLIQAPESRKDYSSGDLVTYYEDRRDWISNRHQYIFERIEKLLGSKNNASFLDIGCGIGFSLFEAKKRGWNAFGIEPNKDLVKYAREKLFVEVANDYFPSSQIPYKSVDFILIDYVLENLSSPAEIIKNATALLGPDGVLLIAVPPVDWARMGLSMLNCIREKVSSATVNMYNDTFEHINFFPKSSIAYLAEKNQLELLNINFHHHKNFEMIQAFLGLNSGYFFLKKNL